MQYAQIVLGLPVDGPFDYAVPEYMRPLIQTGSRVEVFLRKKRMTGYVIGLSNTTDIPNTRNIVRLIDTSAVLDNDMLLLTRQLARNCCCSWGEVIETALPEKLRRGLMVASQALPPPGSKPAVIPRPLLVHDLDPDKRWDLYCAHIQRAFEEGKRVLVLVPDEGALIKAQLVLKKLYGDKLAVLLRKSSDETAIWQKIRDNGADLVLGMRSAIFAPLDNVGIIIVDEEENEAYKQDQVPHYHARDAALMRAELEGAQLIFGSRFPSVELYARVQRKEISYQEIGRESAYPDVKILNVQGEFIKRSGKKILVKYIEDSIAETLACGGKTLLFLNRTGFATWAACNNCGTTLKCPRCASNLVFHYAGNTLRCHHCPFAIEPPKICPECQSGYIKYTGLGTEKIESELSRIFPQARIKLIDNPGPVTTQDADIFVASRSVIKHTGARFDLVVVLGIDNALNRVDFRAGEKACGLLAGLLALTVKRIIIQTRIGRHPCFDALIARDMSVFYKEEIKTRKELGFPLFVIWPRSSYAESWRKKQKQPRKRCMKCSI